MSVGLICEFNPFHYGHQYIIDKARSITGKPIVCVMSGPFVQRAEPAIINKFLRTKAALCCGASAVIQLPTKYSTANAELFARGAIEVLKSVKSITHLAFGVETDDTEILFKIAEIKNKPLTNELIKQELSCGISYPNALTAAICNQVNEKEKYKEILNKPNNILAIEYICALNDTNITPIPIRRAGNDYNNLSLSGQFLSASAIRQAVYSNNIDQIKNYVPAQTYDNFSTLPDLNLFDSLCLYALRKLSIEQLRNLPDVEIGMEYSIKNAINLPSLSQAIEQIKSKRYTYARIKRICLQALLNIDKQVMSDINSVYTRVLGIKKEFRPQLCHLNSNIITRNSNASESFEQDKSVIIDAFADDIYSLLT
ncbi:MAG: nucleotidyltransferase family protein, partial [Clostridia bacterium]|nr:nucleotidyltransferase family protein [Clostridia bacterium]